MNTISYNVNKLKKAYRRSFRNGKSALGIAIDFVIGSLILLFVLYTIIRPRLRNTAVAFSAIILSFSVVEMLILLIRRELFFRHVRSLRIRVRDEIASCRIKLGYEELIKRTAKDDHIYICRSVESLTADDIKDAIKRCASPITVISEGRTTAEARKLIDCSGQDFNIVTLSEYFNKNPSSIVSVDERQIDEAIIKKNAPARKKPNGLSGIKNLIVQGRLKYVYVGAALFVFSFFMKYTLYYRIVSAICISLGTWIFAADSIKERPGMPGPVPEK